MLKYALYAVYVLSGTPEGMHHADALNGNLTHAECLAEKVRYTHAANAARAMPGVESYQLLCDIDHAPESWADHKPFSFLD